MRHLSFIIVISALIACGSDTGEITDADDHTEGQEPPLKNETENETSGADANLTAPANLTDGARGDSLSVSPLFEWGAVANAAGYEVAIGSTAGGTDILDWSPVGTNRSYSATGLTLLNSEMYFASVRAVDEKGNKGPVAKGDGWQNLECPSGYVKVPGDETMGLGGDVYLEGTKSYYDWANDPTVATARKISDFCVMKYEAKAGGSHTAVSTATAPPWASIKREESAANDDAQEACSNNGAGYQLIGNHHWQAIARNIESVPENFDTSGLVADHTFNHGHTDNGPANALAADPDDANGCFGVTSNGDPDDDCGGGWHINKRTHILTNGEIIWDFSGNIYEWVRDKNSTSQASGDAFIRTEPYSNALKWGPANSYPDQTGAQQAGLGYFWDNSTSAVIRGGGHWGFGARAGLFFTSLGHGSTLSDATVGFRCVFAP